MGRSFITGGLAGLLTSVAALALMSLALPVPERPEVVATTAPASEEPTAAEAGGASATAPVATIIDVPQGSGFASPTGVATPEGGEAAPVAAPSQSGTPEPEGAPALTETETAAEPEADAAEAPAAPSADRSTDLAAAPVATEPAVTPAQEPVPPEEAEPVPPAHVSGAGQAGGPPAPGGSVAVAPDTAPEPESGAAKPAQTGQADPVETAEASALEPSVPADTVEPAPLPQIGANAGTLPAPDPSVAALPDEGEGPTIISLAPGTGTDADGRAIAPTESSVPGVTILRPPGADAPEAAEAAPQQAGAAPAALPPLVAHAAPWSNPEGKPVLAIILLDIGTGRGGAGADVIGALPFPATVALDPLRADAATAAQAYLDAGDEVALLVEDLPAGATPADLEVAFQGFTQALPQSVALVGNPQAAFLRSSLEAQHVAALLGADGRGIVTYQAGLNLARRAAEQAGTPVATIDRLLEPTDAASGKVGRMLDQAAFVAGQKGSAVIALPATPELIAALADWAAGPSGAAVSLAPVSALMQPEGAAEPLLPEPAAPAGTQNTLPGTKVGTFSDTN